MVKRLDIQTLIKVGGGSNPNFPFFSKIFFHSKLWQSRHHIVTAQMPKRSFKIPMTFADGLKISLNQVKERASTATGVKV